MVKEELLEGGGKSDVGRRFR